MKKILFFFLILTVFVLVGCVKAPQPQTPNLNQVSQPEPIINQAINNQPIALNYEIKGCAQTDKGMATRSMSINEEKAPQITVSNNQLIYTRSINHMCCRQVVLEKSLNGNNIIITENWSGIGCRCMCFSEIKATVSNIPAGTYQVNVYEKGTQTTGQARLENLIISQQVIIR